MAYRWNDSDQPTRWPVEPYKEKLEALCKKRHFDRALKYVKTFGTPKQQFVGTFMVFMDAETHQFHNLAARLYDEIKRQGAGPRLLAWLFAAVAMGADLPMMKQFVADGVQPTENDLLTAVGAHKGLLSQPPQENAIACIRYLLSLPHLPGRALVRHAENAPEFDMVRLMAEASTQEVVDEALVAAISNPIMDLPKPGEPVPPGLPRHETKHDYLELLQYLFEKATPGTLARAKESVKNQESPGKSAWLQAHS